LNYNIFFKSNKIIHLRKSIIYQKYRAHDITINKIPALYNFKKLFLKIVIESVEFKILENLIFLKNKIQDLIIEFHNGDSYIELYKNAIRQLKEY
jgi:hypothetical protein